MKTTEQVSFDIREEKFKYLQRQDTRQNKVDLVELIKKLNHAKKLNFYSNTKIIIFLLICLVGFFLISLNF